MYNNYWNPNQSLMYPNVYPNYENNPNYIPIEDPNYRMTHPNAGPSMDPNYEMMYPNSSEDSGYQFSHDLNQSNVHGYRNERQQKAYLYSEGDTEEARSRGDLGHGFWSFSWTPKTVEPNKYLVVFLHTPNMNVINGGWKISSPNDPVYAIESYDRQLDQWVITIHNASNRTKQVTFTLIAKEK
ncbi:hypothetical protein [Bacillus sp. AY2-1]|uniref:hypothetical protein n=1 Tax=Bacillus sp. AY2-1 TaxID=2217828 RepID=UPI0011EBD3F8|nr:hypothetical protein [Bacillus sp. AY2-1]KAA0823498.1 hypothetical protein DN403_16275 [Bacillus sp. AY2-1]